MDLVSINQSAVWVSWCNDNNSIVLLTSLRLCDKVAWFCPVSRSNIQEMWNTVSRVIFLCSIRPLNVK